MIPTAGVSTLLAARRPGNPLGWILFAIFLISVAPVGDTVRGDLAGVVHEAFQPVHVSVWIADAARD